jgi:hypothetical protein
MVTEAIDWVLRSIEADARVKTDRERLDAVLADGGVAQCG